MKLHWFSLVAFVVIVGCAGVERDCSSGCASDFGSNWIIVQMDAYGNPFRCWKLTNVSVSNENGTDGIYWLSGDGHLVHLSGFYNRVQVEGDWDTAFAEIGLTEETCRQIQRLRYNPEEHSYH
jgi:hypothetical protein